VVLDLARLPLFASESVTPELASIIPSSQVVPTSFLPFTSWTIDFIYSPSELPQAAALTHPATQPSHSQATPTCYQPTNSTLFRPERFKRRAVDNTQPSGTAVCL
jgi:hypothetical protein